MSADNCASTSGGTEVLHTFADTLTLMTVALGAGNVYLSWCPRSARIQELRNIMDGWRVFMQSLQGPIRERFEREYPGYLASLETNIRVFEYRLAVLSGHIRDANLFTSYSPWNELAAAIRETEKTIQAVDVDFRTTTERYRRGTTYAIPVIGGDHVNTPQAGPSQAQQLHTLEMGTGQNDLVAGVGTRRDRLMASLNANVATIRNYAVRNAVDGANHVINVFMQAAQANATRRT